MRLIPAGASTVVMVWAMIAAGCVQPARTQKQVVGASSFRFVERMAPPAAAGWAMRAAELQPVDVIVPAEAIQPLAHPRYPRAALGRVRLPVVVGVRITVDTDGRVADIGPSLAALSTGSEFGDEFRAAVEHALERWRFIPAELRHLEPKLGAPGQPGYWLVTRSEKTDHAFDLSFTFTADGDVVPEGVPVAKSR